METQEPKNGIIPKYGNFDVLASIPIDGKTVKETVADMLAMEYAYIGLLCFVWETKKIYVLQDEPSDDLANWKEIGGGTAADILFNSNRPITRVPQVGQNLNGTTILDFLERGFYDFVAATMSMASLPLYEKGLTTGVTVKLTVTVNANSETIFSDGKIFDADTGTQVSAFTAGSGSKNANDIFAVKTETDYRAVMTIGGNGTPQQLASNVVTAKFYAPTYHGVAPNNLPTETQIKAFAPSGKRIRAKANDANLSFSPNLQHYIYAYPSSFGAITSIIDQNGFNVTAGFTSRAATFTLPDGTQEPYTIVSGNDPTTQTNFKLTFNF